MSRTIIHVDLDAFFCSIEEKRDPSLRGKAFAVGGRPDQRGVVASCSYEARRFGVRSAMSTARALAICPQLLLVSSSYSNYREASEQVMDRLRALTPLIEQLSIDEAFLDATELVSPDDANGGYALAQRLQNQIKDELGLSCSIGVASNKLVAKVATDFGKASVGGGRSPQAICVVPPGEETAFLAPLPVNALWGVGPKTAEHLTRLGITTIGQLAQWPQEDLIRRFGRHGYSLWKHAQGIDKRDIETSRETKSISNETTFDQDIDEWDALIETINEQSASVARQLKRHGLQGSTIRIKLRWPDFTTPTRQLTLPYPTAEERVIRESATHLLSRLWPEGQAVRLVGVGISGLSERQQLSLWDAATMESPTLELPKPELLHAELPYAEPVEKTEGSSDEEVVEREPVVAQPLDMTAMASIMEVEPVDSIEQYQPSSDVPNEKQRRIQRAVAHLQQRFGTYVVRLGKEVQKRQDKN